MPVYKKKAGYTLLPFCELTAGLLTNRSTILPSPPFPRLLYVFYLWAL
ncbi:hypothetical protein PT974_00042 [Cladobotryum mycophilum]|uniref:Uncharacterized protein n=1 Tax=Cladobotryum mycophilum TaxID=491253 RepID=A0ABR0T007_9HYPO